MKKETIEWIEDVQKSNLSFERLRSKINLSTSCPPHIFKDIPGNDSTEKAKYILSSVEEKPIEKKKINIIIADNSQSLDYVEFLKESFDVIVLKIENHGKEFTTKDVDLVLFTGGEDVIPFLYGQQMGSKNHYNEARDFAEESIFKKFAYTPKLGICRGAQFLTVMHGGSLIQHVVGHQQSHVIQINNNLEYEITSSHHQMLFPFSLNERNYEIIAYSKYFRSNTYLNGEDKETLLPENFVEPEIVYYPKYNSLCIQGHPEWSHCPKDTKKYCLRLIEKYLFENKTKDKIIPIKEENYSFDDDFEYEEEEYPEEYLEDYQEEDIQVDFNSSHKLPTAELPTRGYVPSPFGSTYDSAYLTGVDLIKNNYKDLEQ